MSTEQTAVAEEPSFQDWAKARTFGTPKTEPAKEDSTAGADKTDPEAPGQDKTVGVPAATEPEEIKAADPDDEKEDDEHTAEALKNPGARKRLTGWARRAQKLDKAEREIDRLRALLAAKPAEAAPVKTEPKKQESSTPEVKAKPVSTDFKDVDEFLEALSDWKVDQQLASREQTQEQKVKQEAEQARTHEVMRSWDNQVKAVVTEAAYADFADVVLKGGVQYPDFIAQALYEDENGVKVAYQLAKEPALLKEIAVLSPAKAIAKIGRLSAKFDPIVEVVKETPQEKPTPKQSAAPTPIRPSSTPTQTSVKAAEEMTNAEWMQKRNKATGHR